MMNTLIQMEQINPRHTTLEQIKRLAHFALDHHHHVNIQAITPQLMEGHNQMVLFESDMGTTVDQRTTDTQSTAAL